VSAPPGDPRVSRTRATVLGATSKLLLEVGCERITIDEIAERSGVARSTIYRNWGDRSALLIEAVEQLAVMAEPPDTGSLRGDLEIMAERLAGQLAEGPLGQVLPSLVGAASFDAGLRGRLRALAEHRFAISRSVFERAVARGEIDDTDVGGRLERFIAPFFTRHLLHNGPVDAAFRDAQVEAALRSAICSEPTAGL